MTEFSLEQTGRSVEETLRQVGFDPADLLRRRQMSNREPSRSTTGPAATVGITSSPPGTTPPPASLPAVAAVTNTAIAQTETPSPTRSELYVGIPRQIQVSIPENVADLQGWVENYVWDRLGVKPPPSASAAAASRANPARVAVASQDSDDDAALVAELEAWFAWKVGGGGPEPTLPIEWRPVLDKVFSIANVAALTFEVHNGRLTIHGLSAEERSIIYGPGPIPTPKEGDQVVFAGLPAPVDLSKFTPTIGGNPMTMAIPQAGRTLGGSLWGLVKQYGVPVVVAWLTSEYVNQGMDENSAKAAAEQAISEARPKGRRRRRRMLTCSDKDDIMFLRNTLGGGELGKSAIAALLAGCRR